jgi:hypothetical protein
MLKGVLKDREFNLRNENEEATTKVWDELTFDEVQSFFHNWMSCLASVIENGRECIIEQMGNGLLPCIGWLKRS